MFRALLNFSHPLHGYHLALLHLQSEVQDPWSDLSLRSFHLLWIFPLHLLFDGTASSVHIPHEGSLIPFFPSFDFKIHQPPQPSPPVPLLSCSSLTIFFDCQIGNTSPGSVQPPTFSEVLGYSSPAKMAREKAPQPPNFVLAQVHCLVASVRRAWQPHHVFLSALSSSISYQFPTVFNLFLQDPSHPHLNLSASFLSKKRPP